MLRELRIENIAIIDRCEIEFGEGFNILTGETGAGKSIVLGALNLILGERANADDIRSGADSACVEALFEVAPGSAAAYWLEAAQLATEDGELIVRRDISSAGRSRHFINGHAAPLAQLRELGDRLVDLHGQHQHQALLNAETHQTILDQFGGHAKELEAVREAYVEWTRLTQRVRDLQRDERELERRKDMLRFQIDEIDQAELQPGEDEELAQERRRLQHAETLQLAAQAAYDALYEGETNDISMTQLLARVESELSNLAEIDPSGDNFVESFNEIKALIDDLASRLRDYRESIESDPGRLEWVDERLETIKRLKRKYGASVEEILRARDEYGRELDSIEHRDEELEEAQAAREKAEAHLTGAAKRLSEKRRAAAKRFAKDLVKILAELHMPKTRFDIRIEPEAAAESAPGLLIDGRRVAVNESGIDSVEFMISPNPGEALKPLRKIASGGELSRIMLALKSMISARDQVPIMVFDEIDVGISGAAAEKVGEKMRALGRDHQVICITHLPQIAARADAHFRVAKQQEAKATRMRIERLSDEGRLEETARLLGGAEITKTGLRHARELIENSG